MKKAVPAVLVRLVVVALLLTGCVAATPAVTGEAPAPTLSGPEQAAREEIVVAFSGASLLDEFQISLYNGIADKAKELGINLLHVENGNDPIKQAGDIEDLLAQDIDALLITAANADAIVPSVKAANAAGIPVFTVDQGSNGGEVIAHSGNDNYCMGYRSMEYLINAIGGQGKVMHITGVPGVLIVNWNTEAARRAVADHPGVELVAQQFANWDPAQALAFTEDALTSYPDLAGIYVHSECMTGGVVQALGARNMTDRVLVVSGGWAPESQQWLSNGEIIGTIEWDSYGGGQQTLQAIYDYLVSGTQPPRWNPWPLYMHTASGEKLPVECPIGDWTPFGD